MATDDEDDFESQQDGSTLANAHEIMQDPKRHKAALGHLKSQVTKHQGAMDAFKKRTGKRMAAAFGPKGKSPYAKASGNQNTPFDEAESGE